MTDALQRLSRSTMQTAPLFSAACGLISGVLLDYTWQPRLTMCISLFAATSVLAFFKRIRTSFGPLLVFIASVCAGGVLHAATARTIPPSSIERYVGETRRIARLRGVVASEPRVLEVPPNPFARWTYGHEKTAFLLAAEWVEGLDGDIPVTGKIRVTVGEALLDLREHEHVEVFGWLYRMGPASNPGSFDWAKFHRRQGVVAAMYCKHKENVRRLDSTSPRQAGLRSWMTGTARAFLIDDLATGADEEISLLEAMILGHRSRLDRRLDEIFIRSGCIHYLSVSGTHVVMLLSFVWLVGRVLLGTKRRSAWLMAVVVCAYALIAEPRPPILRATIMALIFCASLILRRSTAHLNWMSASAVLLVAWDPLTVFDVGFQLSFAAVLGVSYLTGALLRAWTALRRLADRAIRGGAFVDADRRIADDAPGRSSALRWRRLRAACRWFTYGVAVSVAAWLAGVPIVAVHFNRVQPWGALASVVVWPLIYVEMIVGLLKMLLSAALPAVGAVVGNILIACNGLLIRVVEALSSLPGASVTVAAPPGWSLVLCYLFLLLFALRFRRARSEAGQNGRAARHTLKNGDRWLGIACAATFGLLLFGGVFWKWGGRGTDRLTVTVLSVGAGSTTVIELPNGQTVLYDAGSMSPYDVGRNVVVPFLRHRGIRRIDEVYLSHPNLDHYSGLPSIIEEVQTGPVVVNGHFEPRSPPRSAGRRLLDILAERRHPFRTLDPLTSTWDRGGVTFEVLWPPDDLDEGVSTNDTSTVLRLSYAGRSILLPGDIMEHAEEQLVLRGGLHADVLVLPHHGSVKNSTKTFVAAVGAEVLIRSSHQRMGETLSGLQEVAGTTPLYNTADGGAVQVVIDSGGVRVSSTRGGLTESCNSRNCSGLHDLATCRESDKRVTLGDAGLEPTTSSL